MIVGSGAGGAVAGGGAGRGRPRRPRARGGRPLQPRQLPRRPARGDRPLYRDAGLTIAEGRPPIPVPVARAVGGTTVINSGTCFRAPDPVLEDWRERFGIDWARDLDADFAEAEEFLRVTPLDPEPDGPQRPARDGGRRGARRQRWADPPQRRRLRPVQLLPLRLPRSTRSGACTSATCRARSRPAPGCAPGSKPSGSWSRTAARSASPAGSRTRAAAAAPFTVRARRAVVAAGGAFGTPELLLRSGLGNGAVGRNLRIHPACWVGARYEEEVRGWDGVMQSYYVDQWEAQGVLLEATFTPPAFGGAWLAGLRRRAPAGDARPAPRRLDRRPAHRPLRGPRPPRRRRGLRMTYDLTRDDTARLVFGIARAAEVHFAAGAAEVYPNLARVPVLRPGDLQDFEATPFKPSELRLEGFHPMGTARIAADPAPGACAPTAPSTAPPASTSPTPRLFPTALGVNPMMTIIAFAKQVSRGIATGAAGPPWPELGGGGGGGGGVDRGGGCSAGVPRAHRGGRGLERLSPRSPKVVPSSCIAR